MQLGINGWPPVASHMACLILGVALAHLSRAAGAAPPRLPIKGIVLSVPSPGAATMARVRMFVALPDAQGNLCRMTEDPIDRLPAPGLTVALPLTASARVPDLARALQTKSTKLVPEADGARLPLCGKGPKVIYGAP